MGSLHDRQVSYSASDRHGSNFLCCVWRAVQELSPILGGGPRVVVSTAAFHARVRGSVPGLGGLKETKNVSSPSTCESQYCGEPP